MLEKYKVQRNYKKVLKARDKDFSQNSERLNADPDAFGKWMADWDAEIEEYKDEYFTYLTRYWSREAIDKLVELPDWSESNGCWERSRTNGKLILTAKGVFYTRAAVRRENMESHKWLTRWFPIGISFFSLAIAFAALLLSK